MPEPLAAALRRHPYELALCRSRAETLLEIVAPPASLPPTVAWYTCAE